MAKQSLKDVTTPYGNCVNAMHANQSCPAVECQIESTNWQLRPVSGNKQPRYEAGLNGEPEIIKHYFRRRTDTSIARPDSPTKTSVVGSGTGTTVKNSPGVELKLNVPPPGP